MRRCAAARWTCGEESLELDWFDPERAARGHDAHLDHPHPRRPRRAGRRLRAMRAARRARRSASPRRRCAVEPRFFVIGRRHARRSRTARRASASTLALSRRRRALRLRRDRRDPPHPALQGRRLRGRDHAALRRAARLPLRAQAGRPLRLLSGYRSPAYNEGIRRRGARAASGSLHTEGLAADLALSRATCSSRSGSTCASSTAAARATTPGRASCTSTSARRATGRPSTSRVDENLSAGNARVFARTDFDRYTAGEMMLVRLHGITAPPVRIERTARLVPDGGGAGRDGHGRGGGRDVGPGGAAASSRTARRGSS